MGVPDRIRGDLCPVGPLHYTSFTSNRGCPLSRRSRRGPPGAPARVREFYSRSRGGPSELAQWAGERSFRSNLVFRFVEELWRTPDGTRKVSPWECRIAFAAIFAQMTLCIAQVSQGTAAVHFLGGLAEGAPRHLREYEDSIHDLVAAPSGHHSGQGSGFLGATSCASELPRPRLEISRRDFWCARIPSTESCIFLGATSGAPGFPRG